jgi:hypothetical protein
VLADGERAAAESMTAVCTAIRTLRDLCDSNAEVAELCGVSVADIREFLASACGGSGGQGDGIGGPSKAAAGDLCVGLTEIPASMDAIVARGNL